MPGKRIEHRQAEGVPVEGSYLVEAICRAHDPHLRNRDVVRRWHVGILQSSAQIAGRRLLNHLIRPLQERRWDCEAERSYLVGCSTGKRVSG
jgi:hypothetical protein